MRDHVAALPPPPDRRALDAFPSWRHLPRWTRRVELALCVLAGAVAVTGCVLTEAGYGTDIVGVALYFGALLLVVPAAAFNRALAKPDGVGAVLRNLFTGGNQLPTVQALRNLGSPGWLIWLLPFAVLPLDLLTVPLVQPVDDLDDVASTPWMLFVFAPVVPLLGLLLWMLVVLPVLAFVRALLRLITGAGRAGSDESRYSDRLLAGTAGLLISVVVFATTLVLGAPDLESPSRRAAEGNQFLALLGFDQGIVEHPALLWVARAALVAIVLAVVTVARTTRAARRGSARSADS